MKFGEATWQVHQVAEAASSLRNSFKVMANSINRSGKFFESHPEFTVALNEEDWQINVCHFGVKLSFQLFLSLSDEGARGNVVCVYEYSVGSIVSSHALGSFQYDRSGRTSFGHDEQGYPIATGSHADKIVAYFLQQAYSQNNTIGSVN